MSLALAALVLSSLSPTVPVTATALGQKVQIINGKKGTVKAAGANSEGTAIQVAPETQGNTAKSQELDRKSAELDAKNKDLAQREQALQEKEATASESDKKKADQQKAMQKHIEKIGEQNQQMMQQASDSLAGD
jgi:hypothetical protein